MVRMVRVKIPWKSTSPVRRPVPADQYAFGESARIGPTEASVAPPRRPAPPYMPGHWNISGSQWPVHFRRREIEWIDWRTDRSGPSVRVRPAVELPPFPTFSSAGSNHQHHLRIPITASAYDNILPRRVEQLQQRRFSKYRPNAICHRKQHDLPDPCAHIALSLSYRQLFVCSYSPSTHPPTHPPTKP